MTDSKLLELQAVCLEQASRLSALSGEFEAVGRLTGITFESALSLAEKAQQEICGEADDCEKRFSEFY